MDIGSKIYNILDKILGKLGVDYVVEEGTDSGGWTYRKWNSGVSECWRRVTTSTLSFTILGGFYVCLVSFDFPSALFIEEPAAICNAKSGTGYSWGSTKDVTSTNIQCAVFKNQSSADSASVRIYAVGRWK